VNVVNLGGGQLGTVTCPANPAAWLTCVIDNNAIVRITVSAQNLTASPAPVTFDVSAASEGGVSQGTAALTVGFAVEQPVLAVTPTHAELTGTASVVIQASNIGAGTLQNLGTIGCSQPANISCGVNQSTGAITITTAPGQLAPGTYVRVVSVVAANTNNSETVTIVLTVPPPVGTPTP
jgi:hypothetical protein